MRKFSIKTVDQTADFVWFWMWQTSRLITGCGTCSLCLPANVTKVVTQSLSIRYPNNRMLCKVQQVLVKCDVDTAVQRKDLLPTLERTWLLLIYGFHACRPSQLISMNSTSQINKITPLFMSAILCFIVLHYHIQQYKFEMVICVCVFVRIMHCRCTSRRESRGSIYRSSSLCSLRKSSSE